MKAWFADESFNADILRGVQRRVQGLEVRTVELEGMKGADDPLILARAAAYKMLLLTHDERTMPDHAYDRVAEGLPMPGVIVVPWTLALRVAIDDLRLIAELGGPEEFRDRVERLPL